MRVTTSKIYGQIFLNQVTKQTVFTLMSKQSAYVPQGLGVEVGLDVVEGPNDSELVFVFDGDEPNQFGSVLEVEGDWFGHVYFQDLLVHHLWKQLAYLFFQVLQRTVVEHTQSH